MRYYCYNAYDSKAPVHLREYVETFSEEEIRNDWYPYWLNRMYEKYDKNYVDSNYNFEDSLEDWITVHWAWESTDEFS